MPLPSYASESDCECLSYTEPETLQPIGDDPNEVLEDTRLDLIDNRENKLHTEASSVDDPENRLGDTLDETLYTDTNSRGLDGNMIPDTLDETLHTKEDSRELEGNMIPDDPSETLEDYVDAMLADEVGHASQSLDVHNNMSNGDEWGGDKHAAWEGDRLYTGRANLLDNDEGHLTSSHDQYNNIADTFSGTDHKSWDGETLYDDNAKRLSDAGGGEFGDSDQLCDTIIDMLDDDRGHSSQSLDINNNMSEGDEYGGNEHKAWEGEGLYKGRSKVLSNDEGHSTSSLDSHNDITDTFSGNDHKSWDGSTLHKDNAKMLADDTSKVSDIEFPTYTMQELVYYQKNNEKVKSLFEFGELVLERMLTSIDMSVLYGLYDYLKLPFDVIKILLDYCAASKH